MNKEQAVNLTNVQIKSLDLVHYGSCEYDPEMFMPISDDQFVKPRGGLWTSPVGSIYGWKEWCEDNEFHLYELDKSFRVKFSGNVFTIDCFEDALELSWCDPKSCWSFPLFQPLVLMGVDAIHLTIKGEQETRFSKPSLYGWDCESVLIMNKECIKP